MNYGRYVHYIKPFSIVLHAQLATGSNEDVALLPPLPHLLAAALAEYPQAPSYSKDTVSYSQLQVNNGNIYLRI